VVHKGVLIVETCIEKHSDIKVGSGRDCAVRVPKSAWPRGKPSVDLLRWHNGWHAMVPEAGELQLRGQSDDALLTTAIGGQKCLALQQSDGRLVLRVSRQIGEFTVMFQFVRDMAMPLVTRERTVVRIGLVHADRLICEQVFADGAEVCIGPRPRDSIVLSYLSLTHAATRSPRYRSRSPPLRSGLSAALVLKRAPIVARDLVATGSDRRGIITQTSPEGTS